MLQVTRLFKGHKKDSAICCLASWEQVLGILQGSFFGEYMDRGSKLYSLSSVDRIWGKRSCYNIPKAIFYLLKGDYQPLTAFPHSQMKLQKVPGHEHAVAPWVHSH